MTGETRKKELDSTGISNLAGTGLCDGHNLPGLIGIGLTNLLKNGEDQSPLSRYLPAALLLSLLFLFGITESTLGNIG